MSERPTASNALSEIDFRPPPPCPEPFSLVSHVLSHASRQPDKVALALVSPSGAEHWSYGRLEEAVRRTAGGFLAHGLAPGDRVLMRLGNTVEFPIAFLGAIAAELIPIPTSSQLTKREITQMSARVSPAIILAGDGIDLPEGSSALILKSEALASLRQAPPAEIEEGDPNRPAYILFTSGTTGTPHAVLHAHRAVWARQMMIDGWYGLADSDRLFHSGALNWTFTLGTGLLDPLSAGATALVPAASVEPSAFAQLLARHDATILAGVPGIFRQILKHDLPDLPMLRHGLSAGEKLPMQIREDWMARTGTEIYEAFGMSECSTFISAHPGHQAPSGALGYPQQGRHIALLDANHRPVPRGKPGTIAIGSDDPGLMFGYYGDDAATQASFSSDGAWFVTHDLAEMSEDGALYYLGRSDDMMNSGGYRVSPIEVEKAMAEFPGIQEVAAADIEVKPGVHVIGLFYRASAPLDEDALSAFAADRLARYKCPRLFVFRDSLPRNANGKLLRTALRQNYEDRVGQT